MANTGKKGTEQENVSPTKKTEENAEGEKTFQPVRTKMSKGERRARKLLSTLGLKPIGGLQKVIVRKTSKMTFAIVNAEVYQINGTKSFVIFGDAKTDELANPLNSIVNDKLKNVKMDADVLAAAAAALAEGKDLGKGKAKKKSQDKDVIEEKATDRVDQKEQKDEVAQMLKSSKKELEASEEASGTANADLKVDADDIKLIVGQTGSTPEEARACLKKNNNDLVQTIIELSK